MDRWRDLTPSLPLGFFSRINQHSITDWLAMLSNIIAANLSPFKNTPIPLSYMDFHAIQNLCSKIPRDVTLHTNIAQINFRSTRF